MLKIMVVEDNDLFALLVDFTLKDKLALEVKNVTTGEECLANLDFEPEIVVLDYALPGINGLTVLTQIREVLPKTKVIVLSGQKNIQIAVNCINSGAVQYIEKNNYALKKLVKYIKEYQQKNMLENDK